MSGVYDDVLIPMVAKLVRNAKVTPAPEDLVLLKSIDVRNMATVFDAAGEGRNDKETYELDE